MPDPEAVYKEAADDLEGYWARRARELEWYQPWDKVLDDSQKPFYKWFVGGKTNIVLNAIDRDVRTWRRNKLALIWEGENGEVRTFSYHALNRELCKFSIVLRSMGIGKGDRVTIYMPRIPEAWIAILACAKIGAVHSIVYGGFSDEALHGRIEDSESKLIITADGGYMGGKVVELKKIVDEALTRTTAPENVVVVKRVGNEVNMEAGRDFRYHELMNLPLTKNTGKCETEVMDAEDPLFILYTSGTTGKPKAVLHTHGGYQVGVYSTLKDVFDLKEEDRWWCTADPGWIAGHSYIVYGPLLAGATTFAYEGANYRLLMVVDPSGEASSRQILIYCIALLPAALMPAMVGILGIIYFVGAVILTSAFLWLAIRLYRDRSNANAKRLFFASLLYLSVLVALMIVDRVV